MNTSETLNLAADLIEQRGWVGIESRAADPWGFGGASPMCLEGGIAAAIGRTDKSGMSLLAACPAARAVHDYLQLREEAELWRWNDAIGRTAEQVIEVLRAAAVIEAARESEAARVSA